MELDDFLKDIQDSTEERIKFLDNKASLLLAIQTAVSIFVFFFVKDVFISLDEPDITRFSILFLTIFTLLTALIILFIIQTIKPTSKLFAFNVEPDYNIKYCNNHLMWYNQFMEKTNTISKKKFLYIYDNISKEDIISNYKCKIYILFQLIHRKYIYYDKAVWLMKINVCVLIMGVVLLLIIYF